MEKLIVTLTRLGCLTESDKNEPFDMNSFNNRLIYQKLIFLLNEVSVDLNYNYNWYIRGPYSPELSKELYYLDDLLQQNKSFLDLINEKFVHNKTIDTAIGNINNLESSFQETFDHDWNAKDLEILASLLFIDKYTYSECRNSKKNTLKEFENRNSELADNDIEKYWDLLKSNQFI